MASGDHTYRIPETGAVLVWPARRDGLITTRDALRLPAQSPLPPSSPYLGVDAPLDNAIPLTLTIERHVLEDYLSAAERISPTRVKRDRRHTRRPRSEHDHELVASVGMISLYREITTVLWQAAALAAEEADTTLTIVPLVGFGLRVDRADLIRLDRWIAMGGDEHRESAQGWLGEQVQIRLFPPQLLHWIVTGPPRGGATGLMGHVAHSLWFAERLVEHAWRDHDERPGILGVFAHA
jgi:hypothetical protein